jgi:hypothetical protein
VVWGTLQTIVSGSVVALVAFVLARRRFKTERWHESRGEAYGKLNRLLHEIDRATGPLAEHENRAAGDLPALVSEQKREQLLEKAQVAQEQLGETFAEHRYLLSPRGARIIQEYLQKWEGEGLGDSHSPDTLWHIYAQQAHRDFNELYQVEISPQWGFLRGVRRFGRRVGYLWSVTKASVRSARQRVSAWRKVERLRFGPPLTQADVRTPPRFRHFRSVEEMERLGWSRRRIQRELRQQLAADPPPWYPPAPPFPPRPH